MIFHTKGRKSNTINCLWKINYMKKFTTAIRKQMNKNWISKIQNWFKYRRLCLHSWTISTWANCKQGFLQLSNMISHFEISRKWKSLHEKTQMAPKNLVTETQRGSIKMHVRYLFSMTEIKIGRCGRGRHSGRIKCGELRKIIVNICTLYRFLNLFRNNWSQILLMVVSFN